MNHKKMHVIAAVLLIALLLCGFAGREWTQKQVTAHQIAELARILGLPENDPIIVRASEIWWEDDTPTDGSNEPENADIAEDRPTDGSKDIDLYSGVLPYELTYDPDTEYLALALAQLIYGEFRGGWSQMEQAAVVQCVFERYYKNDPLYGGSNLWSVLTMPNQFAYSPYSPTIDDYGRDLVALARDVIYRNKLLQQGYTRAEAGIVLGEGYCWYVGRQGHNWFYNQYGPHGACGESWNWALPNPYGS